MLSPKQLKDLVSKRFASQAAVWFAAVGQGQALEEAWPLRVGLGSVTEEQALPQMAALRTWVGAWLEPHPHWSVSTVERKWPRLGVQTLPQHAYIPSVSDAVAIAGQSARWSRAMERAEQLRASFPSLDWAFLGRQFDMLADYPVPEFTRLHGVLAWLAANPGSGVRVRELPIEGVDSKWVQSHQGLLSAFLRVMAGREDGDFYALAGLQRTAHMVRVRILCPDLRKKFLGLCDMTVPLEELESLELSPKMLLLVENQATGLSLPNMPGTVAVLQMGRSVGALGRLSWMKDVPAVYWGDIDTYGFVCLNQARLGLPQLESVLMDEQTLLTHTALWAREEKQAPDAVLGALSAAELEVFEGLKSQKWGANVRMEQERVLWPEALQVLWAAHRRLTA